MNNNDEVYIINYNGQYILSLVILVGKTQINNEDVYIVSRQLNGTEHAVTEYYCEHCVFKTKKEAYKSIIDSIDLDDCKNISIEVLDERPKLNKEVNY